MDIVKIQEQLRDFAQARDWEQYHSPKNLAMALTVEAGELQEIFQWMTTEESQEVASTPEHASEEIADVFLYLVRLADVLDIDIDQAVALKLKKNAIKYPAEGSDTPRSLR